MRRLRSRGFLFTFDALLGSLLILAAILVVISQVPEQQPVGQTTHYAQDALRAMSSIEVGELENAWVKSLIADGTIDDPERDIVEQLGAFWATNQTELAENLSRVVFNELLPEGFGLAFSFDGDILYEETVSGLPRRKSVARQMVTGVQEGSSLEGSTGTAYLKRISSKETRRYAYFGGFVGQGNVTVRLDDLPADFSNDTVREIILEGEFDSDFDLLIGGVQCGSGFTAAGVNLQIQRFNVTGCANLFSPGNNTVTLLFTEGLVDASVSGGYLSVTYQTSEFKGAGTYGLKQQFFPEIDGVINLYDGFMVPGSLRNMSIFLHYDVTADSSLPIYFDIGNTTIFTFNGSGEQSYTFTDAYLSPLLNYSLMSNTTTPFRLGFYEGNSTNSSGNVTDAFLITSRHYSMSTEDIVVDPTTNISRIEQVKNVDDLFVDILLNATGNRVGLVSFGTGASVDLDSALSVDNASLHAEIAAYAPHPTDAQRYLCGAMETAKAQLLAAGGARKRAVMLMTDGDLMKSSGNTARCDGSPTKNRALVWADAVKQACDFSDPVHGNPQNITFYTVAFGPDAVNDPTIVANLSKMANCTGGMFASGTNASELEEVYRLFAEELAASSIAYTYQRATTADNVASRLFNDSFIELTFDPNVPAYQQNQIPVVIQTDQFQSCSPTVTIPTGLSVSEAHIVSYSGDFWTKRLAVSGSTVYDLSLYGSEFANLGDPYQVLVPPELLTPGNHNLGIFLGANASQDENCSYNDSMIYTALINSSVSRSGVLENAVGCEWLLEFEDGHFLNVSVPSTYAGSKQCNYTNASIAYDSDDSYDVAVFQLVRQLDFDKDGRIFVNIDAADLEIIVTIVSGVPYLWGPSIARLEVWQ